MNEIDEMTTKQEVELHKVKISNGFRDITIELLKWHLNDGGSIILWWLGNISHKIANCIFSIDE